MIAPRPARKRPNPFIFGERSKRFEQDRTLTQLRELLDHWNSTFCRIDQLLETENRKRQWPTADELDEFDRLIFTLASILRKRPINHERAVILVDKRWKSLKLRAVLAGMALRAERLQTNPPPLSKEVKHFTRIRTLSKKKSSIAENLMKVARGSRQSRGKTSWVKFRELLVEPGESSILLKDPFVATPKNSDIECYTKFLELHCEFLLWGRAMTNWMQARAEQHAFYRWREYNRKHDEEFRADSRTRKREAARIRKQRERSRKKAVQNSVTPRSHLSSKRRI